ncbi:preprotein translocase subunit YajC [Chryseolinea lacunae]|uniref:Sec translocon accessory complex subunit YajC n=1 Tax=Chryseolinea lacunae TaxID=2801331 RepID=A0ABS1KQJ9_9BACT|nr:preprotein translocase subunit YajC [Chryseolinea lacunae]MBL0741578.1 preprotein translocase subunit YajC [Chryseolinea lacunae]
MYSIVLQAQAQPQGWFQPQLLVFAGIIIVFYFFMIRPQQKKAKDQKKFIDEIKKGDYIVTIGGAHGYIAEIDSETFILEVEKGGRIKFNRSAISLEATKAANAKK